ncbi:hypothetical protein NE237_011594 [Protea cynaroides]|uniref:Uncharacterized protein n=1 Tax=Protea cynaroides TaxID=273540 RepID=A0A9Q0JWX0_9MAGN|nr:hypothetical protein NE237_011594 [Protea cynaroides]
MNLMLLLPLKPKNPLPLRSPILVKFAYEDPSKLRLKLNEPVPLPPNVDSEEIDENFDRGNEVEEEEANVIVSSSPPKNALLLIRSRSAPYRASSLASGVHPLLLKMLQMGKKSKKTEKKNKRDPHRQKKSLAEIQLQNQNFHASASNQVK